MYQYLIVSILGYGACLGKCRNKWVNIIEYVCVPFLFPTEKKEEETVYAEVKGSAVTQRNPATAGTFERYRTAEDLRYCAISLSRYPGCLNN
jgi:hypothetical protein